MPKQDSIDKIVTSYFACVAAEPFSYKGVDYTPRKLRVSPYIFRGFTCPAGCAACCSRFSLDYLPKERRPYKLEKRFVDFDKKKILIYSDLQEDHDNHHCRNVNRDDGRCKIHGSHPFSCDFELIRFMVFEDREQNMSGGFVPIDSRRPNVLTQKLYGRSHAMLQVGGDRGAMCTMTPPTQETVNEVVRKLKRLRRWCEHFQLLHKVDAIIQYAEGAIATGGHTKSLTV